MSLTGLTYVSLVDSTPTDDYYSSGVIAFSDYEEAVEYGIWITNYRAFEVWIYPTFQNAINRKGYCKAGVFNPL